MNSGSSKAKVSSAAPRTPSANGMPPLALAVILAAGEGSRLAGHGNDQPKPGIPLLGLSLSERTILACMDAGIRRFVVVLGHKNEHGCWYSTLRCSARAQE